MRSRTCGWFPVDGRTYFNHCDCPDPRVSSAEDNTSVRDVLLAVLFSLSLTGCVIGYAYVSGVIR